MHPYVSIDLETTGLDFDRHQVIEIGAVIDDWVSDFESLPRFSRIIQRRELVGSPFALHMNHGILAEMIEGHGIFPSEVAEQFLHWLQNYGLLTKQNDRRITCAGKNFASFDRRFLEKLDFWPQLIPMQHRTIDIGNLFWLPGDDDDQDKDGLPDLQVCCERAGIIRPGVKIVTHRALGDAELVVQCIRSWHIKGCPSFEYLAGNGQGSDSDDAPRMVDVEQLEANLKEFRGDAS